MIQVCGSWRDIGEAVLLLQEKELPMHETPQKNWDHALVYHLTEALPKSASILDLGFGSLQTLAFCRALGFTNVHGIDFTMSWRARLTILQTMRRERRLSSPFRLYLGDMLKLVPKESPFDLLLCLSVIEHGVDLKIFFEVCKKMLAPQGTLLVTTDYWPTKVLGIQDSDFGLPWHIFDRIGIEHLMAQANQNDLRVFSEAQIPEAQDKTIVHRGRRYTSIALTFGHREN